MKTILFVCTGNVCRSPMAEGLFRHAVAGRNDYRVLSAGLGAMDGQPPSPYAVEAMKEILNFPNALIGLSDGGAHVQFQSGFGFSTRLLAEWVRDKQIMSLETAVRRLTFESASTFGLYDRGLLHPGMAADVVIFDPATVKCGHEVVVRDFPKGAWRIKEPAEGIFATIVNGQVLYDEGKHTGALPGRVLRNTYWHANHA